MNSRREPLLPDIDDAHHANDSNIIKLTMISPEARDHNDAGGFLAANYGKQQQQDKSDNEILGSSDSIEIPQTLHLLNQTSHVNYVTAEMVHIQNSFSGFDSKKLKFQADKTLWSLLLDGEPRSRNISEQNDSGIHTGACRAPVCYSFPRRCSLPIAAPGFRLAAVERLARFREIG
ncbi:hypothetical protein K0M31_001950 [Melipona bicolor]|uniref:Uncharacterized protein n=1 Tax=Melipona bicolor TaxID=60889 RepID=A0AA40GHN7_9HYME|nr:hypothetical protein K0M31_001950 [Melipona bicolor]